MAYNSMDGYIVFELNVDDDSWDVLYWFERSEKNPYGIKPDGKGWLLEVGIPYSYIPTAVLIPHKH